MNNPKSVVTIERLQTFLDKLKTLFVKKDSDANLSSVIFGKAATVSANANGSDVTVSVDSGRDTSITMKLSDGDSERTVATCEDTTQTIKARVLQSRFLYGDQGESLDPLILSYPGVPLPSSFDAEAGNYLGEIITTRTRHFELRGFTQNDDPRNPVEVQLYGGSYTYVTLPNVIFKGQYNTQLLFNTNVYEYWIDLSILETAEPEDVNIQFENMGPNFIWAASEPDWQSCIGYRFQIHIIGYVATVVAKYKLSQVAPSPYEPMTIETGGSLQQAVTYANKGHLNDSFMWMLNDITEDGHAVVKPIWHTSNGQFIDALGYVLSSGTTTNNTTQQQVQE